IHFFVKRFANQKEGAKILIKEVHDPQRYGVAELDGDKILSIEEKPKMPKSNFCVTGIYMYDSSVFEIIRTLKPSHRGELEITDVNNEYLRKGKLSVEIISRGVAWLDTGTPEALLQASNFFGAIEARQGLKVACLEEIALNMNFITLENFREIIENLPKCDYRNYLQKIYNDKVNVN
ncbi:MAG: sugar phosphate nucleotidyltransferase, partial [Ignavibacteria bacterium]|nr:sugar phosphate nucleotidyltransferase [Ignavibacteria bacterium]